ncbi:hypothetical protein E1B28_007774 [Marasmius oreades]|uniref:GATA-type domain-containing protein n=1 Tax=Marasmius oreades TaxID=181124 RepID=A0A9P7S2V8_9AGAR|nr:uncharacterized protein E1B28_007774 [Marasmius oreades]KAG7094163.1 hypothetical protein E1B28_007774 [Marasmius oreades]
MANEKTGKGRPDPKGVDFLTEAIRQLTDASINGRPLTSVTMRTIESPRMEKWKAHPTKHYTDHEWTQAEKETFEESIAAYGAELRSVRDDLVVKSMPEVVRFYGHWKSQKLGEEHRKLRENGPPPEPNFARYQSLGPTTEGQTVGPSDEEGSIITAPSKPPSCGACRTKESKKWLKAPKGLQSNLLCDNCGLNWRRYADLNVRPVREESLPAAKMKTAEKREGSPLSAQSAKRAKTSASVQSTPPPPSNVPQIRCSACTKNGPVGKVLKCNKCSFQCHAGKFQPHP